MGSIGVMYTRPWVSQWQHQLIENKQKVDQTTEDKSYMTSTQAPHKLVGYNNVALKKEDLEIIQETLDDDHEVFIEMVHTCRGERLTGGDLFTGRYWNARRAQRLGLIDGIDTVDSYIANRWGKEVTILRWYHPSPWDK